MAQQSELEFLLEVGAKMSSSYQKVMKQASDALKQMANASDQVKTASGALQGSISGQEAELNTLKEKYADVVLEKGKNSKAAKKLEKEYKKLSKEVEKNRKKLKDSTKALDDVEDSSQKAGKGLSSMTVAMGNLAAAGVQKALSGLQNVASAVFGLSASTRDYRTNAAKLSVTMAANGYSADYTAEAYKSLYGYLGDDQTVTTTLSNLSQMKLEQGDLNTLIAGMQGVWAAYGDSIPLDGLAESVNETAKTRTVTGNLADALNWAGISEDVFNEQLQKCSTEQDAQRLIVDTLNTAYGGLKDAYDEAAKSTIEAKEAEAEYNAVTAGIGEQIEPVTTALQEGWNKVLAAFGEMLEGVDMGKVVEAISSATSWITETAIPEITGFVSSVGTAVGEFISHFEGIVQPITDIWESVKEIFNGAITFITSVFSGDLTGAIDGLASIWNGITDQVSAKIELVKEIFNGIISWVKDIFTVDGESAFSAAGTAMGNAFAVITDVLKAPINAVIGIINNVIDAINGVSIDFPDWIPGIGGKTFGVNIPHIPELATGGIVTDPTLAMIGEGRGPEAVVPLNQLDRFLSASSAPVTFAPVINVTGGGDVRAQVRQALDEGYVAFEQNMRRYQRQQMRTSFAH